jgi:hypothetical protein
VLALALALLWRDRRSGLILLPAMAALLLAFGLHRFGNNVAHAPAYFVGFGFLAVMVILPRTWMAPLGNRLALLAALGTLTAFFDLLTGSIPALLSLAVVLNHFVWGRGESWRSTIIHAVTVAAAFSFGCIALVALRMSYLSLNDGLGWQVFFSGTGGQISGYTVFDVIVALWDYRYELTPGGAIPGGIFLELGAAAWICTVGLLMRWRAAALDVFVLACSALGVLVWCAIFRRHTAYHAWFTVRLLTLPAAYGLSSLLVCLQARGARAASGDTLREELASSPG